MKRMLALLLTFLWTSLAVPAFAAEPFDQKTFAAAQDAGAPILVHVSATWCPTCRAQLPSVAAVENEIPGIRVFRVDFDEQKDVVRSFKVASQSTLIAFHGRTEVGRSTGVTDPAAIRELASRTAVAGTMPGNPK